MEALPEFKKAKKILAYISLEEEVDTRELVKDSLEQGKTIYVPKVIKDHLVICHIKDFHELKPGSFGVLEPCEVLNPIHPGDADLILVPGIAFDQKGHRIGFGKGFYDSLLKLTKGFKVGLAFHEQILDEIPREAHDIPLDLIITDQTLIRP